MTDVTVSRAANQPQAPAALPSAPLPFVAIAPCRLADTRAGFGFSGAWGPPGLAGGVSRDIPIIGQCTIPPSAQAVSANFTATNTLGPGFLAVWPQGRPGAFVERQEVRIRSLESRTGATR